MKIIPSRNEPDHRYPGPLTVLFTSASHAACKNMALIILIPALLILLLMWVIFVPVLLKINSRSQEYYIRQPGIFSISLSPDIEKAFRIRVFGIHVKLKPATKPVEQLPVKKKKPGSFRKKSADDLFFLIRGIMRAIKIKELILQADLNDVVLNAQVVPLTLLASRGVVQVSVNFNKTYYFGLIMEARIHKMLWTYIRFLTKK